MDRYFRMDNLVTTADAMIGVLSGTGVTCSGMIYPNLAASRLIEMALHRGEGRLSTDGALVVDMGFSAFAGIGAMVEGSLKSGL